jgi:hypothetical protein
LRVPPLFSLVALWSKGGSGAVENLQTRNTRTEQKKKEEEEEEAEE